MSKLEKQRPKALLAAGVPLLNVELNTDIRAYVAAARTPVAAEPWASKPEVPSSNEILGVDDTLNCGDVVNLVANQVQGPWPSVGAYLKAHYELLREDAVAPLRDSVAYVRATPKMMDSPDTCIYEKVRVISGSSRHHLFPHS
jgi:helicase required for RNAi-mediated heterochromatin assembly 1